MRNTGRELLELGTLTLPSFMNVVGDNLPGSLGRIESALLQVEVNTTSAGRLEGKVSLDSNDPDANENPFTFDVIINVSNEPANVLFVQPGVDLPDVRITPGQRDVSVLSFQLLVPDYSAAVTIDRINLSTSSIPNLTDVKRLTLYIDGGTRGEVDTRDIRLARLTTIDTLTFDIPERTLLPGLPLWLLVVADF